MEIDKSWESIYDSVGFVVDRTLSPEKTLGPACLISTNRMLVNASAVFKYIEAPWALAVNFPHADLQYAVKSISLHPTFNTTEAHWCYLSQTGSPQDPIYLPENDMAVIEVEPRLRPLDPQLAAELNMKLAIQLPISDMDVSHGFKGEDMPSIIKRTISIGTDGLLTVVDSRNIPIARLDIHGGKIRRATYKHLTNEAAVFELIYQKPAGAFLFQTSHSFVWPNVRNLDQSADALIGEAILRAEQVRPIIHALGGPEARYLAGNGAFDPNLVNPNLRWVAERLWPWLDGYLSIEKLTQRIGVDTYSIVQALQDMLNNHLIDIYRKSPFVRSGQIGTPLVPTVDMNIEVWDELNAFYLDPLSGRPIVNQGNFFGPSRLVDTNVLLHTVPVPHWGYGALVLKDNYLIGLYTGIYSGRPGHTPLPQKLYRSVWVAALQDIENIRKEPAPPTAEELAAEAQEKAAAAATLKAVAEASQPLGRFICANCHARNVEVGMCRSCGVDMEEAALGEDPAEKMENARRLRESSQTKSGLHPGALVMLPLSIAIIGLVLFFVYGAVSNPKSNGNHNQPSVASNPNSSAKPVSHDNGVIQEASTDQGVVPEVSMESLIAQSGLKSQPVSEYSFEDTSFRTEPMPSFGMISQEQNQKMLFTIWGNNAPLQNLDSVAKQVPFANFQKVNNLQSVQVARGQVTVGGKNMDWFVGRYPRKGGGNEMAMVCAYKAPAGGKTVVVIARPYSANQELDYMKSLSTINNMVASQVAGSH